jgi:hypothetical protein
MHSKCRVVLAKGALVVGGRTPVPEGMVLLGVLRRVRPWWGEETEEFARYLCRNGRLVSLSRGSVFQATSVIPIPLKRGLEAPVRVPQNPMGRRRSGCRRPRRQRPSRPLRG